MNEEEKKKSLEFLNGIIKDIENDEIEGFVCSGKKKDTMTTAVSADQFTAFGLVGHLFSKISGQSMQQSAMQDLIHRLLEDE